jgi:hypothetical protein
LSGDYIELAAISEVTVLAAFFMRNHRYFVIKIYPASLAQQFSALERDRTLPHVVSFFDCDLRTRENLQPNG